MVADEPVGVGGDRSRRDPAQRRGVAPLGGAVGGLGGGEGGRLRSRRDRCGAIGARRGGRGAVRRPRRRRSRAAPGGDRCADPAAERATGRRRGAHRRTSPDADGLHASLHRGLGRARRRRARRPRRPSQGRHRDGPRRGRPAGRARAGRDHRAARTAAPAGRRGDPSGERRRRRRPRDRRSARSVRGRARDVAGDPGGPRGELGRRLWPIHSAVLVRSSGDRHLRDLARSRRRPSLPRAAPGVEPAGAGLVPEAGRGRDPHLVRVAPHVQSPRRRSPRSPSATPTGYRVDCSRPAAKCSSAVDAARSSAW